VPEIDIKKVLAGGLIVMALSGQDKIRIGN